jgi:hypothetical protein
MADSIITDIIYFVVYVRVNSCTAAVIAVLKTVSLTAGRFGLNVQNHVVLAHKAVTVLSYIQQEMVEIVMEQVLRIEIVTKSHANVSFYIFSITKSLFAETIVSMLIMIILHNINNIWLDMARQSASYIVIFKQM